MTDQLPSKDQLCGHCQLPIHPSDSRRHFGFYVAHTSERCVQLLQMEIERLQRENDTCGLQCSATLKSLVAENERLRAELVETEDEARAANVRADQMAAEWLKLRTALTGISTCSTCEACRGAALRALRGEAFEIMRQLEAENMETCNPDWCPTCMKSYAECRCNGVAW